MNTLLITGGSGFVGGNLSRVACKNWKTWVTYHTNVLQGSERAIALDIQNREEVKRVVSEVSPQVIIHTAGLANVHQCALDKKTAWQVNVAGTENIARVADQAKARLIYISTDLVFSGDKCFYTEEDIPAPVCYYGKTKLEGEKMVASFCHDYCIARTALIFGLSANSSKCFTEIFLEDLKNSREVKLFTDEYRSPIYIQNLCEVLLELAERKDLQGIYHICGPQRMSRFELGVKLCEIFGFDRKLLVPTTVSNMGFVAQRPPDCSMSHQKAAYLLKTRFGTVEEGLQDICRKFSKKCVLLDDIAHPFPSII